MEYKKIGEVYYIRMDRDDEVIENILDVCRKESIPSAIYSGIGGCGSATLQVFIP
jgi:predicted DNA-binding protein with PD1-like motif